MLITGISPDGDPLGGELLALQRASYAVEAAIIGDDRIPPLHESLAELRAQPLLWLGAMEDDRLVGAVAWEETAGEVDLNRLVVHPAALRRGIGRALVKEVMARASGRRVVVSTGRDNTPARRLYERLGFVPAGQTEVIPGLWLAHYACPAA
ncbi:Acetyltransferase (GNAT) domain-containing protein [Nonomuraea solani]|uniref:Acetyltransferase (GNAT) domain-containing protein n=1 Tax=Nonomuraea solani TaxID=1144553 RepID=A0A1H6E9E1_9ACTN|nr:GNAT family N-acetyltransferase [Nonomuraea solani]SEG94448.1 Acetyltransferase (GNAT) domain-containing protein [Nonomuraea solani]